MGYLVTGNCAFCLLFNVMLLSCFAGWLAYVLKVFLRSCVFLNPVGDVTPIKNKTGNVKAKEPN